MGFNAWSVIGRGEERCIGRDRRLPGASIVSHSRIPSPASRRANALLRRGAIVCCFFGLTCFLMNFIDLQKQSGVPGSTSCVPPWRWLVWCNRPGISCNYWDGISTVGMINGHLALFLFAIGSYLSPRYPISSTRHHTHTHTHTHRSILNTSSITSTEHLSIIPDHCGSRMPSTSCFFRVDLYLYIFLTEHCVTNFPLSRPPHTHRLRHTFFFFWLQIIRLSWEMGGGGADLWRVSFCASINKSSRVAWEIINCVPGPGARCCNDNSRSHEHGSSTGLDEHIGLWCFGICRNEKGQMPL